MSWAKDWDHNSLKQTVRDICRILREEPEKAERCVYIGAYSRHVLNELWIEELGVWVDMDGRSLSGDYGRGKLYPGWLDRWRIRRAVKAWQIERWEM